MAYFTTQFFVLDKAKSVPIRIGGERLGKQSGRTSLKTKTRSVLKIMNYTVGLLSCFKLSTAVIHIIMLYFLVFLEFATTVETVDS